MRWIDRIPMLWLVGIAVYLAGLWRDAQRRRQGKD